MKEEPKWSKTTSYNLIVIFIIIIIIGPTIFGTNSFQHLQQLLTIVTATTVTTLINLLPK